MNQTHIGLNIEASAIRTSMAVIESSLKKGIKTFAILDIFSKQYRSASDFCGRLNKIVNNNAGIKPNELILNVAFAHWLEMTIFQLDSIPSKFKSIGVYSNRFKPIDLASYQQRCLDLFAELMRLDLLKYITWDLGAECNSDRYWWDTFSNFESFLNYRISIFSLTGRPMLGLHNTTSLLVDPDNYKSEYADLVESLPPGIGFSTSLYGSSKAGITDYSKLHWPNRSFNRVVIAEANMFLGLKEGSANYNTMNSRAVMRYYCDLWKESAKRSVDTVCFFTLLDSNLEDKSRGAFAFWHFSTATKTYMYRPAWPVFLDFVSVIKDGWEETATGIRGMTKEIVLTSNDYILKQR